MPSLITIGNERVETENWFEDTAKYFPGDSLPETIQQDYVAMWIQRHKASQVKAARTFGVHRNTVRRFLERYRERKASGSGRRPAINRFRDELAPFILELRCRGATNERIVGELRKLGLRTSAAAVQRVLNALSFQLGEYSECDVHYDRTNALADELRSWLMKRGAPEAPKQEISVEWRISRMFPEAWVREAMLLVDHRLEACEDGRPIKRIRAVFWNAIVRIAREHGVDVEERTRFLMQRRVESDNFWRWPPSWGGRRRKS